MATGEHVEDPVKATVADSEEHIKDKGNTIKDVKNAGEVNDFTKTNEVVITEGIVVGENKSNEAKTKAPQAENKGKEANKTEKNKDELEKADASKCTTLDKNSSMATEEKSEEPQKNNGAIDRVATVDKEKNGEKPGEMMVDMRNEANKTEKEKDDEVEKSPSILTKEKLEGVMKEGKKKIEAEPSKIVVENKGKEADHLEKNKDEVEKVDASKNTKIEKMSSSETKEKLEETQNDIGANAAVKERIKKIEAEARETVVENKKKGAEKPENKKDGVEKVDASKCIKKSVSAKIKELEETQKDRGVTDGVVKKNEKKNEVKPEEIVVEDKGKEADKTEKKKDNDEKIDASACKIIEKSSSIGIREVLQEPKKNGDLVEKVVREENIEAEPKEVVVEKNENKSYQTEKKDEVEMTNASAASKEKTKEAQMEKVIVEEVVNDEKKIQAEPRENVVENKGNEVDKTKSKKDEVGKTNASAASKEETKEAQMNKVIVEVANDEKKIQAEPRENVVENKEKEVDETKSKKDEVGNVDAFECIIAEKSSSMTTKEKLEEGEKDKSVVGEVVKDKEKKIEAEPTVILVENESKESDITEKEKAKVEKTDASEEAQENKFVVEEVVNDEKKKIEVEPKEIMVDNKTIESNAIENKKDLLESVKASTCSEVEKSSTVETKEKLEEELKDRVIVEDVAKEEEKESEAEPREIVLDDKSNGEPAEEVSLKEQTENDQVENGDASESGGVEKSSSLRVETTSLLNLNGNEKTALAEFRLRIANAIHETAPEVDDVEATKPNKQDDEENNTDVVKVHFNIKEDTAIWGVPLLPGKEDNATNVILLKFLKAKDFDVNNAFEMLTNTLKWRKDNNIDSILDENFIEELNSICIMNGVGREGHPVYYSTFKLFGNEESYNNVLGNEEKRNMYIRSRIQLMERAVQKLDFKSGGVSSVFLVNDCKDMPGPSKKELRNAIKQMLTIHQDNYPEFVARHIFINVPFWYYAFSASTFLSPFLTPRSDSKFVFARPAKMNEIMLKYIALEELPVNYGGLRRENDADFSTEDALSEISINQSSKEMIRIPAKEGRVTIMWEVLVPGWEVTYKEEFIPEVDSSNSVIILKGRKISGQEGSIRNTFTCEEPGHILLTIENGALIKKKRIFYRYKIKN